MKKTLVILASVFAMSGAFAQASAPAPASAAAEHQSRVEERIAYLHTELKITPDQETQWQAFANVMRANGETMGKLFQARMAETNVSALDDMKQYAQIAQAHADGMAKLVGAFEPLYNAFSPDQKKVADVVFRQRRGGPEHGATHKGHTAKPAKPAQQ